MITVADLIAELDEIAPPDLADADDRIGLQVGSPEAEVRRVCVSVDTSGPVIDRAIEKKADLLVAHHPLIYRPLTSVAETDPVAKRVAKLIRASSSLFVLHTNYDSVPGGINDVLATKLGVVGCNVYQPLTTRTTDPLMKIVVFVPEESVETIRSAMADAGAGQIGNYAHCSFRSVGRGTFLPLPGSQPYLSAMDGDGIDEVEEYRLEMVAPGSLINPVVAAMLEKHPYDEVAYDLYELANEPITCGYGRIGVLEEPMGLGAFFEHVKSALEAPQARVWGEPDRQIKHVAFCGGGGSSLFREAASGGAEVYVTGDATHHNILDAAELGMAMIDAGHFQTEKPGMVALAERLAKTFAGSGIEVEYTE